ncbi:MAG: diguanylate cyclase, partial [Actinoplanes sp.]|nr:diguanylate cyclase [Actinoplanes sp.]
MFTTVLVIAIIALALAAGAAGYGLGLWVDRPIIEQLAADLANAAWRLAHDPLTGILNRDGLHAIYVGLASNRPSPLAVALIDLEQFKVVNDTYSHAAGDHLLIEVAHRLRKLAGEHGGIVARLSGDEFAAVTPLA